MNTNDKTAAVEALYRYVAGVDLENEVLLRSALADDAASDSPRSTRPTR